MAWSDEVVQITNNVSQLKNAVNNQKTALTNAAFSANTSSFIAANNAIVAANNASVAFTHSQTAGLRKDSVLSVYPTMTAANNALIAAQSNAATINQTVAATSAALPQDLSGINAAALHRSPNAITAMFVYDTSKDSDGGAWTEKCQHTSWYNEPIMGQWLGAQGNETLARMSNVTLGDELISNRDFSDGSTGWILNGFVISNGVAASTGAGGTAVLQQNITTVPGRLYRIQYDAGLSASLVTIYVRLNSNGNLASTNVGARPIGLGPITEYVIAEATTTGLQIIASPGANILSLDNISVREVLSVNTAAGDYYQSPADGRFYQLQKNLYSQTTNLTNTTNWPTGDISNGTRISAGVSVTNPEGYAYIARPTNSDRFIAGVTYTFSVTVVCDQTIENVPVRFITGLGSAQASALVNMTAGIPQRISLTLTATTTGINSSRFGIDARSSLVPGGSDNTGYIVTFSDPQLEIGTESTAYEPKTTVGSISETFRGNKRDFPRLAGIVAEASAITIYDLTEPGRPMWMRFWSPTLNESRLIMQVANITSIACGQGRMLFTGSADQGTLTEVFFITDSAQRRTSSSSWTGFFRGNLSQRNNQVGYEFSTSLATLVGAVGISVAMTVLPDAPVDPVTGLRVPTIAVATSGGLSIIKHDGRVVNSNTTAQWWSVGINPKMVYGSGSGAQLFSAANPGGLGPSFSYVTNNTNAAPGHSGALKDIDSEVLFGINSSFAALLRANRDNVARSLTSRIAPTFNTGWMTGDVRRCFLSDTEVGSQAGTELVTNGTFDTDLTGWTGGLDAATGNFSVVSGALRISTVVNSLARPRIVQAIPTIPGRRYRFRVRVVAQSGTSERWVFWNTNSSGTGGTTLSSAAGIGVSTYEVVATSTTTFIALAIGATVLGSFADFDDISVTDVVFDRSYRGAAANITGTITRSQLASGTSLVGYSGFSADNYLREPYSADLDFGTSEWTGSAWVNVPVTLPVANFPQGAELSNFVGPYNMGSGNFEVLFGQSIPAGSFVRISVDLTYGGSNSLKPTLKNATTFGFSPSTTYVSSFTVYAVVTADVDRFQMQNVGTATGTIINSVSVKQVQPAAIFDRAHSTGARLRLGVGPNGNLTAEAFDGTTTRTVTTSAAYNTGQWLKACVNYTTDGTLAILVNGREVATTRGTPLLSLNSRYNLLLYSENFNSWSKENVTVSQNVELAPNGQMLGDAIIENTTTNTAHRVFQTVSTTQNGVSSVYVKYGARQYVILKDNTGNGAIFDLINVTATNAGRTGTITDVGNGWRRCSVSGSPISTILYIQFGTTNNINSLYSGVLGTVAGYLWAAQVEVGSTPTSYQRVGVATDFDFQAPLTIGNNFSLNAPFPGSIALLKLSATVPTAEQESFMFEQEKQLFRPGALSVLPDSSSIVDMSYDDATDRWVAVSASNESYWTGLVRNSVTPVPAGSYSRIATASGVELTARTTTNPGVDVTIPPYGLREELVKRAESASRLSRQITTYDYVGGFTGNITTGSTAIASVASLTYPTSYIGARISGSGIPANTFITGVSGTTIYISAAATATTTGLAITFLDFMLPVGQEAKIVMSAGTIRREGSTADYTRLYDGFRETIRFAAAPGATAWVQIQSTRSQQ
jgi:hypothetical protein